MLVNNKKAQTATEYMIILAVVIIIALIVVGVLGGIPGVGGGARSRASAAYWQTADIAITAYSMTTAAGSEHTLKIRNNLRDTITITDVSLSLSGSSAVTTFNDVSTTLAPGEVKTFNNNTAFDICATAGDAYTSNVQVTYDDDETGSTYVFTGEGNKLEGDCAQ